MTGALWLPPIAVPGEAARDAARLRQYLKWAAPPNFVAAAVLFLLHGVYGSRLTQLIGIAVLGNGILAVVSYRLTRAGHVQAAALCVGAGLWTIAAGLALAGASVLPVTIMCALIAIPAASPYVTARVLGGMCAVLTALVVGAVGIVLLDLAMPLDEPDSVIRLFQAVGIPVLTAVCGLSIWHNRVSLHEADGRLERTNAALRDNERLLERRVEERTAELAESERDLALARDAALEANRQKSAFLTRMSHELRTPLNAIIGFTEVLGDRTFGELNDKQGEYVSDIHSSGMHLLSLIDDILDMSRVESGEITVDVSIFDLRSAIESAAVLVRERALHKQVRLIEDVAASLGPVRADERKIRQVVINLLANAVKFTPPGGTVTLRAYRRDGEAVVSVVDTGVGISEADQSLIFDEFAQARQRQPDVEGTGLGLALSKRVVELHGGRIWVQSRPGEGSEFAFSIPDTSPTGIDHD